MLKKFGVVVLVVALVFTMLPAPFVPEASAATIVYRLTRPLITTPPVVIGPDGLPLKGSNGANSTVTSPTVVRPSTPPVVVTPRVTSSKPTVTLPSVTVSPKPPVINPTVTGPRVTNSNPTVTPPKVIGPDGLPLNQTLPKQENKVPEPVSLEINPANVTLKVGEYIDFKATLTFSDGSTKDVSRDGVFVVGNKLVAYVRGGRIYATLPGTTTINMTSYGKTARINVTVLPADPPVAKPGPIPEPVKLDVNPTDITLKPGEYVDIKAVLTFSDNSTKDVSRNGVFIVANKYVANFSAGRITGIAPGITTIDMRTYGKTAQIKVTVLPANQPQPEKPKPVSLAVNPDNVTLDPGQSQELKAILTLSDGSTQDVTSEAMWMISNANVVSINGSRLQALSPGTATVWVRDNGLTARVNVKVNYAQAPKPTSLTVDPDSLTLNVGETKELKANVAFTDGTIKDISLEAAWSISDPKVASVNQGMITALTPGNAVVMVSYNGLTATANVVVAQKQGTEDRTITWQYGGKTYEQTVKVPKDVIDWDRNFEATMQKYYTSDGYTQYLMLKQMPSDVKQLIQAAAMGSTRNPALYAIETRNSAYISTLASELKAKAQASGYDRFQTAEFTLSFVQSLPYVPHVYMQLPAQTLLENGDCDDRSVLLASLLKSMGYDTVLLVYDANQHTNLGIAFNSNEVPKRNYIMRYREYQGKNYYLAETTNHDQIGLGPFFTATGIYPVR